MSVNEILANESIPYQEFILVGNEGQKLGIKTISEGLQLAKELNLDLVVVNEDPENPVCKILSLSKKKYDEKQRDRKNNKNHKKQKLKEVRFTVNIDEHDLKTKANQANSFLTSGMKVKLTIKFPTRQSDKIKESVQKVVSHFLSNLQLPCNIESESYSVNSYSGDIIIKK